MKRAYVIEGSEADTYDLGIVTFKLLIGADQTDGRFSLGEFAGKQGPWTVLHIHENSEEAFYILDGTSFSRWGMRMSRPDPAPSSSSHAECRT